MSKKLFVGNLSWDTRDDSLRQAFEAFGAVTEAKVITDRDNGRSKGFGFVTFAEADHAAAAVSQMDGATLDTRTIRVALAQDQGPRRAGPGGAEGGGGGRNRF
ncbi:MAG: RNA-binding protein [Myxococcales bacterium]|nr:RNA-binding protein [Myxococcales bacterium]MCC6524031.1 RNA-binding protein [Polyangiaceae bacterium]